MLKDVLRDSSTHPSSTSIHFHPSEDTCLGGSLAVRAQGAPAPHSYTLAPGKWEEPYLWPTASAGPVSEVSPVLPNRSLEMGPLWPLGPCLRGSASPAQRPSVATSPEGPHGCSCWPSHPVAGPLQSLPPGPLSTLPRGSCLGQAAHLSRCSPPKSNATCHVCVHACTCACVQGGYAVVFLFDASLQGWAGDLGARAKKEEPWRAWIS